jgi:hypothetical protein
MKNHWIAAVQMPSEITSGPTRASREKAIAPVTSSPLDELAEHPFDEETSNLQ